ncbi:MAG: quinone oxidoreductase, partial [Mesorhizobium sp.]
VPAPPGVTDIGAAVAPVTFGTVEHMLFDNARLQPGEIILIHAGGSGIGSAAIQLARKMGCTVITTVGSNDKIDKAKALGADHVINYREQDFVAGVLAITGGKKCDVVYDSVGNDTFPASLDCLKPLGMFASFGQSSGPVPPFSMSLLAQKGSLFATRPTLFVYNAKREDLEASAAALFEIVLSGAVKIKINQRYALKDAGKAHSDLEGRRTTGTTILIP